MRMSKVPMGDLGEQPGHQVHSPGPLTVGPPRPGVHPAGCTAMAFPRRPVPSPHLQLLWTADLGIQRVQTGDQEGGALTMPAGNWPVPSTRDGVKTLLVHM